MVCQWWQSPTKIYDSLKKVYYLLKNDVDVYYGRKVEGLIFKS